MKIYEFLRDPDNWLMVFNWFMLIFMIFCLLFALNFVILSLIGVF